MSGVQSLMEDGGNKRLKVCDQTPREKFMSPLPVISPAVRLFSSQSLFWGVGSGVLCVLLSQDVRSGIEKWESLYCIFSVPFSFTDFLILKKTSTVPASLPHPSSPSLLRLMLSLPAFSDVTSDLLRTKSNCLFRALLFY